MHRPIKICRGKGNRDTIKVRRLFCPNPRI
jgi:hypothetical protein